MKVSYFHRKARPGNFSIENLFKQIRSRLPVEITWEIHESSYFSRGFINRLKMGFEAARRQSDINHVTGDIHFIVLFLKKSKTILTIHDIGLLNHPNSIARFLLKLFWITLPVRRVSLITTVSAATKAALLAQVKVKPEKIKVIYNPVEPAFTYRPKPFNEQQPTILQIGTKPNKNLPRLIKALEGLNCRLEIVGIMNPELHTLLKTAGLVYHHAQGLTIEELLMKYISADIVSFVSLYEGFGLPIVEANAVGRVVVTSNISAMPEIAGNAAQFVDPFDVTSIRSGFEKVIKTAPLRNALIKNGLENCKRFNLSAIAKQYANLYTQFGKRP